MVPLDQLAAFLAQQIPNKDWAATLAGFSQAGGMPATSTLPPEILTAVNPPTTTPITSTPAPEKSSQIEAAPSASSQPTPTRPQTETLDASPLSAYQDPDMGETEEKGSERDRESKGEKEGGEERQPDEGEEKSEENPAEETVPEAEKREEIDLNEMAKKQGLTTDDEFQSLMGGRNRVGKDTIQMAEGLDLASGAVGTEERSGEPLGAEGVTSQSEAMEVEENRPEEERTEAVTPQPEAGEGKEAGAGEAEPEQSTPRVSKPIPTRRRLVLKGDPHEEKPRRRVSQRCLGRWTASKVGSNMAADALEILSDEEREIPTKPGEEPSTATDQEDTSAPMETISPTPTDQEKDTQMAEGLDLASRMANRNLSNDDNTIMIVAPKPLAQTETSTGTHKEPEKDQEEERYLQERKRKGKAPVTKKQGNKKPRTANPNVVIREPEQEAQPRQQQQSGSEYTSS